METTLRPSLTFFATLVLLSGCAAPTVNLATSDPIKVDIAMRLDVYQYGQKTDKPTDTAAPAVTTTDPKIRRDNRMADIQDFKNNRLVGEGKDGLLVIQQAATEETPDRREYVRITMMEENADRMAQMTVEAEKEKVSLPEVQSRAAELWRNRSFKNEWIEVPTANGEWKWIQKEG